LPKSTFSPSHSSNHDLGASDPMLQADRLDYSLRRYFVDRFYFHHVPSLPTGSRVLDLGGNKVRKRGEFDIEQYELRVVYADLSITKRPDVQADAAHVPFEDSCFDAVICSELLEHVPDPPSVLREGHRVLEAGGILLMCVPFLSRIHGDPYDYGRYTDHYWRENLSRIGFVELRIQSQGLFWSVLVDMLRGLACQMAEEGRLRFTWMRGPFARLIGQCKRIALTWEAKTTCYDNPFLSSFTTGFAIRAVKP